MFSESDSVLPDPFNNKSFDETMKSTRNHKYWLFLMLIVPLITMVGNLLVVISVYHERSLRNTTNYFIVSLAIADISLSVIVMPISIWIEVNNGLWNLGVAVCDAFIVADVTFCTASIINLTAISIDRYVAVTMPLKYSQHQGRSRISFTITMTWLISFAIALPMAFGLNHRENNTLIEKCTFNNADFIIWSSLGSFYIPSVVTISLYFQIFKKIRERANCKRQSKPNYVYEERELDTADDNVNQLNSEDIKDDLNSPSKATFDLSHRVCPNKEIFENCYSNFGSYKMYDSFHSFAMLSSVPNDTIKHSITRETWISMISQTSELNHSLLTLYSDQVQPKTSPFPTENCLNSSSFPEQAQSNLTNGFTDMEQFRLHLKNRIKIAKKDEGRSIFHIPTFIQSKIDGLHQKRIAKKVMKKSTRRERRAIKTLFIVLAVFLVCWAPYFAVNLAIGIAVKFEWETMMTFLEPSYATVTWFGYINSFLNPIIYTTFNAEFRNAFKKILTCR